MEKEKDIIDRTFEQVMKYVKSYSRMPASGKIIEPIEWKLGENGSSQKDVIDVDFSKIPNGESVRREIAYNLALYDCCKVRLFPDMEEQHKYCENVFREAYPIFKSFEDLILMNAKDGKIKITQEQIMQIYEENKKFKYADDVLSRLISPINFRAFAEEILDSTIDSEQENLKSLNIVPWFKRDIDISYGKKKESKAWTEYDIEKIDAMARRAVELGSDRRVSEGDSKERVCQDTLYDEVYSIGGEDRKFYEKVVKDANAYKVFSTSTSLALYEKRFREQGISAEDAENYNIVRRVYAKAVAELEGLEANADADKIK